MGRHLMTFMTVLLVVSCLAVASVAFGVQWPHRELIRFLSWSAMAALIWWRVWLLYRAQTRDLGHPYPQRKDPS